MKGGNLGSKVDPNKTPSGLPNLPISIIGAVYQQGRDYDKGAISFAVAGLGFGIISIFTWSFFGLFSIIFSAMALSKLKNYKTRIKMVAAIGLILGIINFGLFIFLTLF